MSAFYLADRDQILRGVVAVCLEEISTSATLPNLARSSDASANDSASRDRVAEELVKIHSRTLGHAGALLLERLARRDVQCELDRLFSGQGLPPPDSSLIAIVA